MDAYPSLLDSAIWKKAHQVILQDSYLAKEYALGEVRLRHEPDPFQCLIRSIIGQQISVHAAMAIEERVRTQCNGMMTVTTLQKISDAKLSLAGLTKNKISAVRAVTEFVKSESVWLQGLPYENTQQIEKKLCSIYGIGPWTAQMFLIFHLGRPDIFPSGDIGFLRGLQKIYNFDTRPTPRLLAKIAKPWKSYSSLVALYAWRITEPQNSPWL
jgi:3-methyladenine DNA glycosylase/8-oxoguanine DNA glycosylase